MWRLALLIFVVFTASAAALSAAENFPFTAYVAEEEAEVRSGPGTEYYSTDRLSYRTAVAVYRRDAGGWLAIKPPDNSFSWVPAAKLWMTDQKGVAEVVTDDALSWVGSRVENVGEHKWQVRLQRGERVEVLGEKRIYNEIQKTTEAWYQIAPPAGEFRWIHDRSVSHQSGELTTTNLPPQLANTQTPAPDSQVRVANFVEATNKSEPPKSEPSKNGPWVLQQTAGETPITPSISATPANVSPSGTSVPITPIPPRERVNVATRVSPDDLKAFDRQTLLEAGTARPKTGADDEFTDIEAQLALMVSKDAAFWHLDRLREQTEALVENGKTPLERGRARLLLEKIAQFEDLQRRHIQVDRGVIVSPATGTIATAAPGLPDGPYAPRCDSSGWLVPVHATNKAAPPYAIMDDNGKVVQYVTPAPGVNLHRYVKKRVGIYGQKTETTMPLNAPVLTAHRVIDFERNVAR